MTLNKKQHFYNCANTSITKWLFVNHQSLFHIIKTSSSYLGGSDEQRVMKSNGDESVAIPSVISRVGESTSVENGKKYIEEEKKEKRRFRHSAPSTGRTQQWPRINIITVHLG